MRKLTILKINTIFIITSLFLTLIIYGCNFKKYQQYYNLETSIKDSLSNIDEYKQENKLFSSTKVVLPESYSIDKYVCTGYIKINKYIIFYNVKTYIKCNNYVTFNY